MEKAIFITNNKQISDLYVIEIGIHATEPGHRWGPAVRDQYIFHFVISGKGKLQYNNIIHEVGRDQGFLIRPGEMVCYTANSQQPWEYFWITFNGSMAEHYLDQTGLTKITPVFRYKDIGELRDKVCSIIGMNKMKTDECARSLAVLYDILVRLIEENAADNPRKSLRSNKETYIDAALEYIMHHYTQCMDVKSIAGHVGLCPVYLNKIFHDYSGISIRDFIIKLRMDKACILMKNNLLTLAEISQLVGYNDYAQFSKMFSKHRSISPREHRHQIKNNQNYNV